MNPVRIACAAFLAAFLVAGALGKPPISDELKQKIMEKQGIDAETLERYLPYVYPPADGPVAEGLNRGVPQGLGNQRLADMGLLDVTAAPFEADPSGRRDSTRALQEAVDFARVRSTIEELSRDLRAKILDDTAEGGATLGNVFRGVDLLADSEAGRSVNGFYDVILDAEQSTRLQEAISAILSRDFAAELAPQMRLDLSTLLTRLEDEAATVRQTMILLSRTVEMLAHEHEGFSPVWRLTGK